MTDTNHDTVPERGTTPRTLTGQFLAEARDDLRRRRAARAAHRTLERELATYTTPAEVDDLLAAMRGHDDNAENEEIRTILTRRRSYQRAS